MNPLLKFIAHRPKDIILSLLMVAIFIYLLSLATGTAQTASRRMANYASATGSIAKDLLQHVNIAGNANGRSGKLTAAKAFALATAPSAGCTTTSFIAATDYATGESPRSVAAADFNGDGKDDMVTANSTSDDCSILLGNGDGTFQEAISFGTGRGPTYVAVADFNNDGKADVATANASTDNVSVRSGNGDGTFQAAFSKNLGDEPNGIAVADFDGDNKLDMAVSDAAIGFWILLGKANGTFQDPVSYRAGQAPQSIVAGDLNADGNIDIAVANPGDGESAIPASVCVWMGNGSGTFQATINYSAGKVPWKITAGDFNGDGKLDLASVENFQSNAWVMLGNGNGTFQDPVGYAAGGNTSGITAGDINGDGKSDLTVTNWGMPGGVSVLVGNGDGTFQTLVTYAAGEGSWQTAQGNFNGDAKTDLAVVNNSSNMVSVLLSDCVPTAIPPTVTSHPGSTTVTAGDIATFVVAAEGTPTPTVEWQYSADGGLNYININGETNLTLSFIAAASQSGYRYRAVLTNSAGTATSNAATLTVNKLDLETKLESSQNPSILGESVTFTATLVATGPEHGGVEAAPTGMFQFLDGGHPIAGCDAVTVREGQATCETSALTVGNHTITVQYSGDDNFNASTGSLIGNPQVVNEQANPAPTLGNYADSTIVENCKLVLTPDAAPADNELVESVTGEGPEGFTGDISVDAVTGTVTVTGNGPVGSHAITITATDNHGAVFQRVFTLNVVAPPTSPTEYDFDGDRKADVAVYRAGATTAALSYWYVLRSSDNSVQSMQFGQASDVFVPGDYDGDGDTDIAVFRPSINTWFISQDPVPNYAAVQWGSNGDIPVPGFYDADAKMDIAVWRPSDGNWHIVKSTGGTEVRGWGVSGDKPVPADYDGDGQTDVAVWRPSLNRWFIRRSSDNGTTIADWGVSTDLLVPADYDGDGKDDIAIWRPSTGFWYVMQSSNGSMRSEKWGETGDVPVAADYDNDGKADLSVYRPSEGTWHIFSSCPCAPVYSSFGIATDKPVPSAFTPPAGQ